MADINEKLSAFRQLKPGLDTPEVLRRLLESMVSRYYIDDPHFALAQSLIEFVFTGHDSNIDKSALGSEEAAYVSNIRKMRPHVERGAFLVGNQSPISFATQEMDFVVERIDVWSVLRIVNFVLLMSIRPTKRAAVVTSIRNEGVSILEWVAHYKALGFDSIFVYTNNNTDGSNPLLEKLARNNLIRLIYNTVDAGVAPQTKAYEHSLHFLPELRQYSWAFYIDADEFFVPRCGEHLDLDGLFAELTANYATHLPAAVSFNWKWFGSENAYERTDGLLFKRFEYSIHNEHVKTLAQLDCILTMKPVHCPIMFADCIAVNSELTRLEAVTMKTRPVYGVGQINHYWNKSFQEFVIKKFRGRGAVGVGGAQREFAMFFDWGANDRRGNFDPPPSVVIDRTYAEYLKLLELPGVKEDLEAISKLMDASVAEIDKQLNLKAIYDKRGQL